MRRLARAVDRYLLPVLGHYRVKELNEELLEQGLLQVIRPVDGSHKQLGAVLSRECLTLTRRICKYGAHLRLMRPVEIILRLPPKQAAAAKPLDRREQQLLEAFALQAPTARSGSSPARKQGRWSRAATAKASSST